MLLESTGRSRLAIDLPDRRMDRSAIRSSALTALAVIAIFVAALGLRAYGGITWGLPDRYHPDEPFVIDHAARISKTGDLSPHWFNYPSLYIYLQAGLERAGRPLQGYFDSKYAGEATDTGLVQARQLAVGRALTVLLGSLSVVGVFILGGRSYGRLAGLLGAALLAVHVPHIANSQWITTDVPAATCVLGTGICAAVALQKRSLRWVLGASICAGLAAGMKYNAGVAVVMPLVSAVFLSRGRLLARNLVLIGLLSLLVFVATTPYSLIEPHKFIHDVKFEMNHYQTGHPGAEGSDTWRWYAETFINRPHLVGLVLAAGAVYALLRHRTIDLVLLSFVAAYYCLIAFQVVRFERNLMPLVPIVAALGGRLVADAVLAARRFSAGAVASLVIAAGFAFVIGSATVDAMHYDSRLLDDTRTAARRWIGQNIPAGSRVAREFYAPNIGPQYAVKYSFGLAELDFEELVCQRQFVVASSGNYQRYVGSTAYPNERQFYEKLFRLPVLQRFGASPSRGGPTIVIFSVPQDACPARLTNLAAPSATVPYLVAWGTHNTPSVMKSNQTAAIRLSFANLGSLTWSPSATKPVRLSYHWFAGSCPGTTMILRDGARTALPFDIHPGESLLYLRANVTAPPASGPYCLTYDLVQEGQTWFSAKNGGSLAVNVQVQ